MSLNVERREIRRSKGKKERNEKDGEGKKKSFPRVTRSKKFFPFRSHVRAHTFPGYTHISLECEQERGDIYACGRGVRYDICERERNGKKGNSTEREREKDRLAKVLKKKKEKRKRSNSSKRRDLSER